MTRDEPRDRVGNPDYDLGDRPIPESVMARYRPKPRKPERCPASGQRRSHWSHEEWISGEGDCPDCGGPCGVWVRGTDLYPNAKVRAHKIPADVPWQIVAPYAAYNRHRKSDD